MRPLVPILFASFFSSLCLHAQAPRLAEVQERRLSNGARLLLVERRGLSAFHASLVFQGGRAEEPAPLVGATDLLANTLFGATWPEDVEPTLAQGLEVLLRREEGLIESLRLERLRLGKDPATASHLSSLEASLESVQSMMRGLFSASPLADPYLARGGRQSAEASADALMAHAELPQEAFEFWCRTEAQRLRTLLLSRFSMARSALAAQIRRQEDQGLPLLQGAALPGHPYGRDLANHLPALWALRWSDLRAYARKALSPDRMTVILIGGLSLDKALPLVERHLGSIPVAQGGEEAILPEVPAGLGDRRVQAALGAEPRLLVGWRIPPRKHPDHLALLMAVHLLGGGDTSRLPFRLGKQKNLVREAAVRLDVPGGRLPGLLVADLRPAQHQSLQGQGLQALEQALHGEILRLQEESISQEEWQQALARCETSHVRTLDEPAALAASLGRAWVEGGDWRFFDLDIQRLRTLRPEAVHAAARAWLIPSHRTTAYLEPTVEEALNPLDAETAKVLQALAASRIEDPARRERMVAEGLRQLRMLSTEERARTLKLLQAQLRPEKP